MLACRNKHRSTAHCDDVSVDAGSVSPTGLQVAAVQNDRATHLGAELLVFQTGRLPEVMYSTRVTRVRQISIRNLQKSLHLASLVQS